MTSKSHSLKEFYTFLLSKSSAIYGRSITACFSMFCDLSCRKNGRRVYRWIKKKKELKKYENYKTSASQTQILLASHVHLNRTNILQSRIPKEPFAKARKASHGLVKNSPYPKRNLIDGSLNTHRNYSAIHNISRSSRKTIDFWVCE